MTTTTQEATATAPTPEDLRLDLARFLDDANLPKWADYYRPTRVDLGAANEMVLAKTRLLLQAAVRRCLHAEGERDAGRAAAALFGRAAEGAVALEDALRRCVNVLEEVKHWLMPVAAAKSVTEALVVARGVLKGVGDGPVGG